MRFINLFLISTFILGSASALIPPNNKWTGLIKDQKSTAQIQSLSHARSATRVPMALVNGETAEKLVSLQNGPVPDDLQQLAKTENSTNDSEKILIYIQEEVPLQFEENDKQGNHLKTIELAEGALQITEDILSELGQWEQDIQTLINETSSATVQATLPPTTKTVDNKEISLGKYGKFLGDIADVQVWPYILESYTTVFEMEENMDFQQIERERDAFFKLMAGKLSNDETAVFLAQTISFESNELSLADYFRGIEPLIKNHNIPLNHYPAFEQYMHYILLSDIINIETLFSLAVDDSKVSIQ